MKIFGLSQKGLRDCNQDCYFVGNKVIFNEEYYSEDDEISFGVLDGVGGADLGEIASQLSAKLFTKYKIDSNITFQKIKNNIFQINKKVVSIAEENQTIATTIVGLIIKKTGFIYYNLGDSKLYRYRNSLLVKFSSDDNFFGNEYNNHMIFKYIGNKNYDKDDLNIDEDYSLIKEKDLFFLCTDGVTDILNEEFLANVLKENISIKEKAKILEKSIIEEGAKDNFTFLIVEI